MATRTFPDNSRWNTASATRLLRGVLPLAVWLLCTQAQAACSKSDVEYYLDKGFSREQVARLCGGGSSSRRDDGKRYEAYDDPSERSVREAEKRRAQQEETFFIKNAIAGWDVVLTPRKLEYTRKFCLSAGKTPEVEGRTRVCPDVRYRIYFKGLDVGRYERKYFFLGRREIEIKGAVRRKMLHDLGEYPSDLKRELIAAYKNTTRKGATFIPIRRDVPIVRVTEVLRKYARRATERRREKDSG